MSARGTGRPRRFIVGAPPGSNGIATITGAELHHLRNVMKLKPGTEIELIAPDGEHRGTIRRLTRGEAVVELDDFAPAARLPPGPRLILAAAIIKGPRMDFLVEKAAELGAAELWPILCARGVVRPSDPNRLERWRRMSAAAAKQSRAPGVMEVREPLAFARLIDGAPRDSLAIVCASGAPPLAAALEGFAGNALILACGPEGDFDSAEREMAARAGWIAAGLGANRLRSETAALKAISLATARLLDELDA